MKTFLVHQALIRPNGGLIIARHNELRDKIIYIAEKCFLHNCVQIEPLIHLVRSISEEEVRHRGSILETGGEVSIRGLWEI